MSSSGSSRSAIGRRWPQFLLVDPVRGYATLSTPLLGLRATRDRNTRACGSPAERASVSGCHRPCVQVLRIVSTSMQRAGPLSPFMAATTCGALVRRTAAPIFESASRSMASAVSTAEGSINSIDSPSACQKTASRRFAASLIRTPASSGPTRSTRRQSCPSKGCARANSEAAPPAKPTNVPDCAAAIGRSRALMKLALRAPAPARSAHECPGSRYSYR